MGPDSAHATTLKTVRSVQFLGSPREISRDVSGERPVVARDSFGGFLAVAGIVGVLDGGFNVVSVNNRVRIVRVGRNGKRSRLFARGDLGKGVRVGDRRDLWEAMNLTVGFGNRAYIEAEQRGVHVSNKATVLIAFDQRTGKLDRSFGRRGIVRLGVGWGNSTILSKYRGPSALKVLPDNSLIECGISYSEKLKEAVSYVLRMRPDGSRDKSFASNGELILGVTKASPDYSARGGCEAISVGEDGSIVAAGRNKPVRGYGWSPNGFVSTWVRRIGADGTLDSSFGESGSFELPATQDPLSALGVPITPRQVSVRADGSVLVAGWRQRRVSGGARSDRPAAFRLTPDGRIDSTYGKSGVFDSTRLPTNDPSIEPDGGVAYPGAVRVAKSYRAAILRIDPGGGYDQNFGQNGLAIARDKSVHEFRTLLGATGTSKLVVWGWRVVSPYGKHGLTIKEELYWLKK